MPRCALTGENGQYVKAHLIPQALSSPEPKGQPFFQIGERKRPSKRWTSWYDLQLVTEEGEKILAELDDWLISCLRTHKLVWSGWGKGVAKLPPVLFQAGTDRTHSGIRVVEFEDPEMLGRSLLSIVWRTCVSSLPDMRDVHLKHSIARKVRAIVLGDAPHDFNLVPMTLIQLSTKGDVHNHTPIRMRRPMGVTFGSERTATIFRYYFDGFILHAFPERKRFKASEFGGLMLNQTGKTGVICKSYSTSLQKEIIDSAVRDSMIQFPDAKPFRS